MHALELFYEDLAAALAALGVACDGCGRCCRFDEMDHVLFASALEKRYLALKAPPPSAGDGREYLEGLRCPYQVNGKCVAREGRVLGCRLYFCSWRDPAEEEEFYRRWHERLKRLHDDLGVDWEYGPLLPLAPV